MMNTTHRCKDKPQLLLMLSVRVQLRKCKEWIKRTAMFTLTPLLTNNMQYTTLFTPNIVARKQQYGHVLGAQNVVAQRGELCRRDIALTEASNVGSLHQPFWRFGFDLGVVKEIRHHRLRALHRIPTCGENCEWWWMRNGGEREHSTVILFYRCCDGDSGGGVEVNGSRSISSGSGWWRACSGAHVLMGSSRGLP